ncbi:phosphatidylinositol 3,4,5-trisphosphate 3-phosphatase and dual-specificity protein phosphatase PTEN-like [Amphiura filiformis]|uniref:phosphatidylinositol 3,4,5-trisphosphate 3-phosphatase and dual-specificity protein phosphatase PTEN-like n=1 Tax=Amphiura filiformis TaxID=82378 RepID=UPI003B218835
MAAKIRELVSKNKTRYTDGNFDLDLTYICPNIIAMGFPAERLESVYRNDMESVVKFLDQHHKDHYKVYNLCSERNYDHAKFYHRVAHYPFDDHNPPKMALIQPFCRDVDQWLAEDDKNVAAIHCKAGKGRTGVMVCALLLDRKECRTADEAMAFYGDKRTQDGKGVTIPSQRRYVQYYAELISRHVPYESMALILTKVELETVPMMSGGTCNPFFVIYTKQKHKAHTSDVVRGIKKGQRVVVFDISKKVAVCDDVKVEFYHKTPMLEKKSPMFHFWFNTFFVVHPLPHDSRRSTDSDTIPEVNGSPADTLVLTLRKDEIDKANKDKTNRFFSPNLKVRLFFVRSSHSDQLLSPVSETSVSPAHSNSDLLEIDCDEDSSDSDAGSTDWVDSYTTLV